MGRQLIVLRHGKSDWASGAAVDFDRPLAQRGRRAAKRMGKWLRAERLVPDHVASSPAERARQTAVRVCRAAGLKEAAISFYPEIYLADVEDLLAVLAACPADASRVMVVGHNPGLEELVAYLAAGDVAIPPGGKLLPTAAVAILEMPDDWQGLIMAAARLVSITRPRDLD
ncbi:MAG: histidine phosphatase family protein [Nitrospirota bacterium]|jgi:phosphohistidine phosphatase